MPNRDVIAIGASAGGIEALPSLLADLPGDLPAAVLIVLHLSPDGSHRLPEILGRKGSLPLGWARHGATIEPGRAYLAPPDRHLVLEGDRITLSGAPYENRARPAIDPLFRSVAVHHGPRVIGVILTGMLGDGAAGLWAVRRCGGVAVVQDPDDASYPGMPRRALDHSAADHVAPLAELGRLLARLAAEPPGEAVPVPEALMLEHRSALAADAGPEVMDELGRRSVFGCPDCGGGMWEIEDGGQPRFRCQIGHAYSAADLLAAQSSATLRALWSALRAHEERTQMLRRLVATTRERGRGGPMPSWERRLEEYERQGALLRRALMDDLAPSLAAE